MCSHQHNGRQDLVRATRQQAQHSLRVSAIARLSKDLTIDDDDRVGGQHGLSRALGGDGLRLRHGHPAGVRRGVFSMPGRFVDVGGTNLEWDAGRRQEFSASGGRRRKNEDAARHSTRF
jgi:hypothetical protein